MSNWFECKVRYDKVQQDGSVRKVTEPYLVDALSFTEAEARITEEQTPYISGEFDVTAVKRTRISEIIWDENGDRWFQTKIVFLQIDEKGNEKRTNVFYLIQATDLKTALDNLLEHMKGTMMDFTIASLAETPLLDVYKVKLGEKNVKTEE